MEWARTKNGAETKETFPAKPELLVFQNRFSPKKQKQRKKGNFELLLFFPFRPAASVSTKTNACYRYATVHTRTRNAQARHDDAK